MGAAARQFGLEFDLQGLLHALRKVVQFRRERRAALEPMYQRALQASNVVEFNSALDAVDKDIRDHAPRGKGPGFAISDGLAAVLKTTREEVGRLARNPDEASPLHLLAGILAVRGTPADRLLRKHGMTLTKLRRVVKEMEKAAA